MKTWSTKRIPKVCPLVDPSQRRGAQVPPRGRWSKLSMPEIYILQGPVFSAYQTLSKIRQAEITRQCRRYVPRVESFVHRPYGGGWAPQSCRSRSWHISQVAVLLLQKWGVRAKVLNVTKEGWLSSPSCCMAARTAASPASSYIAPKRASRVVAIIFTLGRSKCPGAVKIRAPMPN
jgi:hypothetical protein